MPKKTSNTMNMMEFVSDVVDNVRNGNRTAAAQSILSLNKNQAVVVTAYVFDQLKDTPDYSYFLRLLETYFEG